MAHSFESVDDASEADIEGALITASMQVPRPYTTWGTAHATL